MIGYLKGTLLDKRPPTLVLDVQGVGYELDAPMTTFYDLPAAGEAVSVYTHLVIREDAQLLFAFSDAPQRDVFRSLLKVGGIGPRVALAILSTLPIQDFFDAVTNNDISCLTRVPGIGRKTAERLVMEMRDRVLKQLEERGDSSATAVTRQYNAAEDAVDALTTLGYKPVEASRVIRDMDSEGLSSEELIRRALRRLAGARP
ncbi:MAG: Holliday junction ATP-dependent DNA helicase RuvA [Gammaproteobacteria bacterium]|nr:Holliday junction ATP-dependent DNA helicase RuvA [Gammaproteobacteria bacterium]